MFAAVGCGDAFRSARLTQSVATPPAPDATLHVRVDHVALKNSDIRLGLGHDSVLAVVLDVTNAGPQPYNLNGASISCWMEVSADRPAETLSLAPAGGGEGDFRGGSADSLSLATIAIPPGQTRRYWVAFRGYTYPGSDAPRKITISLPDARGQRVQLVIADPARGQRWQVEADGVGIGYGLQNAGLFASGLDARAMAGVFSVVSRAGPFFYDVGLTTGLVVETRGLLMSETSTFQTIGVNGHVTLPFGAWGPWQAPRRLGVYAGGGAQELFEIPHATQKNAVHAYGVLSATGGVELDFGAQSPAALPYPVSFTQTRPLPRLTLRAGYTHWFAFGHGIRANSGGYMTAIRLAF